MSKEKGAGVKSAQPVVERYAYLTGDKALVEGAKYALVIDFKTGGLHRLNAPACQILKLSKQGVSVEQAMERMDLEPESADSFLASLLGQNLITVENAPQEVRPENKPPLAPELRFIWLEVTSRCNLRCIHCYAEATAHKTEEPSTAILLNRLDQAADLGCRNVQLTGGECTLRSDLKELLSHARQKKYEIVEIFTNATLLDEDLIRFLTENKVQVAVSLYSYKSSSHNIIAGVPGSHSKTLENLKLLLAYGVQVRGSIIAMKQNEKELKATEFFLRELGVASGPADPVRPCGRGSGMKNWPEKYGLSIMRTGPDFLPERRQFDSNHCWNSCWFGKAAITAEGEVLPCVFERELVAGNLSEHSLEWIVHNGLRPYWELTRDKVSVCRDCEYRYICQDCRPWAYGYTGDLYAKTPTCTYNPYTGEWGPAESALKQAGRHSRRR
jgi:radical SAM protein with 4Fe4S-binding SPASM domain